MACHVYDVFSYAFKLLDHDVIHSVISDIHCISLGDQCPSGRPCYRINRLVIYVYYLFVISRGLQGHSADVGTIIKTKIFTVTIIIILTNFCLNNSIQFD